MDEVFAKILGIHFLSIPPKVLAADLAISARQEAIDGQLCLVLVLLRGGISSSSGR
jgi:hypothetical protein